MKTSVLFIMPDMAGGGAEKVLLDMLRHMDYDQYDVTLLLEYHEGVLLEQIPDRVRLKWCFFHNGVWRQRAHRLLMRFHLWKLYVKSLRTLLIQRRVLCHYDVMVSFMEGAAVKLHSMLHARAERHISWIHIDMARKHWSRQYFFGNQDEAAAYQSMDKLVFVSDTALEGFRHVFPVLNRPVCILHNGIDSTEIIRSTACQVLEKSRFTICMAGRLNEQKRYDRALDVAALLRQEGRDFVLRILGAGHLLPALQAQVRRLGLSDHVIFQGFVNPPYPWMAASDIFLNTSEAEGYPLTLCEALVLGLPVVATDIAGARDILGDNAYGLVVREEVADIAAAVRRLMDDASLRNRYASEARRHSQSFDIANTMHAVYELLNR